MFKIRELKKTDSKELKVLFNQLVAHPKDFNYFKKLDINLLIKDPGCHCIVIEHKGKLIGFGSIIIFLTPVYGYKGRIEDVIIHESHREKGLGKKISRELIKIAKKKKVKSIHLTSRPDRIPARKLYESLGFELKETGVFFLNL
jgi:ribosomal protein S18 acetylase RimI-like enzyme